MNGLIRQALTSDSRAIAHVFSRLLGPLSFLSDLHTPDEIRWFVEQAIPRKCQVWIAENSIKIQGFLALERHEIRLLHVHPAHFDRGAGGPLIEIAQQIRDTVELWRVIPNTKAQRLYRRMGFVEFYRTDGGHNEEKQPSIRFGWQWLGNH